MNKYTYEKIDEENLKIKREYLTYLLSQINDLQQKIDNAIKYIKKNIPYWEEWHYDGVIDTDDMNIIIDILKGVSNNV